MLFEFQVSEGTNTRELIQNQL